MANGTEELRRDGSTLEEVGKALGVTRERNGYRPEDLLRCDERHLGD